MFLVLSDVAQRNGCLRPMLVPSSSILQYPPLFPLPHVCRPHFKSVGLRCLVGGWLLALGDPASESSSREPEIQMHIVDGLPLVLTMGV